MKFIVVKKSIPKQKQIYYGEIYGYILPARNNRFKIMGCKIRNIKVTNKKLAHPFVMLQVNNRFQKLIDYLMQLLLSEDDTGEAMNIALNEIEYFRLLIKNEYRHYLKRKELEFMAKSLEKYQKEAKKRLIVIQNAIKNENLGKSR